MKEDIKNIAGAVIESPTEFKIKLDNPSRWDKILIWLRLKKSEIVFEVKRPCLGLAMKITELSQQLKDVPVPDSRQEDWANDFRASNTLKLAEILATYIHGKWREKTPQWLIDFVLDNVNDYDLAAINRIIDSQTNILPFISSIASMRSLDVVTKSLEASPPSTGETIALGE